jgi:hypothetical protein
VEARRGVAIGGQRVADLAHGAHDGVVRGDVAIEVIDERRVEVLLRGERRRDDAPDERLEARGEAALRGPGAGRQRAPDRLPLHVQARHLRRVVRRLRQRRGAGRERAHGGVERAERVVIPPVGVGALALEARDQLLQGFVSQRREFYRALASVSVNAPTARPASIFTGNRRASFENQTFMLRAAGRPSWSTALMPTFHAWNVPASVAIDSMPP